MPAFRVVWNLPKRSTTTAARSGTMRMPQLTGRGIAARSRREALYARAEATLEGGMGKWSALARGVAEEGARMVWTTAGRAPASGGRRRRSGGHVGISRISLDASLANKTNPPRRKRAGEKGARGRGESTGARQQTAGARRRAHDWRTAGEGSRLPSRGAIIAAGGDDAVQMRATTTRSPPAKSRTSCEFRRTRGHGISVGKFCGDKTHTNYPFLDVLFLGNPRW